LLLGKAADQVVERVVNRDLVADFDRQPAASGEIGVANAVLGAGAAGPTEIPRPPVAGDGIGWRTNKLAKLWRR